MCENCENEAFEDDEDYEYDPEEEAEREWEAQIQTAVNCSCGAYIIGKDGSVYHIADCCCGAD